MIEKEYYGLGTLIKLSISDNDSDKRYILDDSAKLIRKYERIYSANDNNSDLMKINLDAGIRAVVVKSNLFELIKLSKEQSLRHMGFNFAIGPVVKLWHIGFSDASEPNLNNITETIKLTNPENIILNQDDSSVFLTQPGMQIDLGAIAKGQIADDVALFWKSKGISSGIINLGGNILTVGENTQANDNYWKIGIENPHPSINNTPLLTMDGPTGSVVTSGIYERMLKTEKKSFHHIINPNTGYPLDTDLKSVTVFTGSSVEGEILSTEIFFNGFTSDVHLSKDFWGAIFVGKNNLIRIVSNRLKNFDLIDKNYTLILD